MLHWISTGFSAAGLVLMVLEIRRHRRDTGAGGTAPAGGPAWRWGLVLLAAGLLISLVSP